VNGHLYRFCLEEINLEEINLEKQDQQSSSFNKYLSSSHCRNFLNFDLVSTILDIRHKNVSTDEIPLLVSSVVSFSTSIPAGAIAILPDLIISFFGPSEGRDSTLISIFSTPKSPYSYSPEIIWYNFSYYCRGRGEIWSYWDNLRHHSYWIIGS